MQSGSLRWALPDLNSALCWCKDRNRQDICCILDVLGEDVKTESQVKLSEESILNCAAKLDQNQLDAAIAIKPTSLGVIIDKNLAKHYIFKIYKGTEDLNINLELDMEGTPLVEYTIETAIALADQGYYVTLALQAYLDRTTKDIKRVIEYDITVRLVKGAYQGDITDFFEIQQRFKNNIELLINNGNYFSVGTHDPEIIEWILENFEDQKDILEFGFLKGLADETKMTLANDGWAVSEYVPFGIDSKAYVRRRERYLETLAAVERGSIR